MAQEGVNPRWVEVDDFIEAYEVVQQRDGQAELSDFLPEPAHPLYRAVFRELVRVDLEYNWERGQPKVVEDYQGLFPQLLQDRELLQELAFEEYRLRQLVGEDPAPTEYQRRFGVGTDGWPDLSPARVVGQNLLSKYSRTFADLQRSDPHTARRLVQAAKSMPRVGTVFLGFHLLEELGCGTFAHVFLARQGELANRYVVLKVSTAPVDESQTLAQLQHTNVVPIHSIHRADPLYAVCMPYFGATTLADVLHELQSRDAFPASGKGLVTTLHSRKSNTRLQGSSLSNGTDTSVLAPASPPEPLADSALPGRQVPLTATQEMLEGFSYVQAVLWIACRLADGLAHAHERGILHRDLKPANILLTDEGQPMLLDFNLSADTKLHSSASAVLVGGTLPYMAPEQLKAFQGGTEPVDDRSDLYSLGIILYELLTRQPPFPIHRGRVEHVLPRMIADRLIPPLPVRRKNPAVSPAVESIIRHCLEPDCERRYQSAAQLRDDLQRQLDHLPLQHAQEPLRERTQKWIRRHRWLTSMKTVGILAVLLVLGLGGVRLLWSQRLAQWEALHTWHQFAEDWRTAQFFLTGREEGAEYLEESLITCRRALARYRVLDDPAWQQASAIQYLPPVEQARLQEAMGELLYLTAGATYLQSIDCPNAARRAEQLQDAARLSGLAVSCFKQDEVPNAVLMLRAALIRLAGYEAEADQLQGQARHVPRNARDQFLLAIDCFFRGDYRSALARLQDASNRDPADFATHFWLGHCYAALAQYAEAVGCYRTCTALQPDFPWAYFRRGACYLRQEAYVLAQADFERVIQLRPDRVEGYLNRALARQGLKDYAGAIADLTVALQCGAPYTRIYFVRARVRAEAGDLAGAKQDREEGLRQQPTDEDSWVARGVARLSDDLQGALGDFGHALELNPRSRTAMMNEAHVLGEKLNRTEEALSVLDRVVALYPEYVPARSSRGVLLARLGRRDAAYRDAVESLRRDSQPATLYQVACIYALTSKQHATDRQQALRLLKAAAPKDPRWLQIVQTDPDFAPVRDHADYREVLQALKVVCTGGPDGSTR
jgi:serine/threonine protein kinase/tetratricopeptide (TPR) repeat protein